MLAGRAVVGGTLKGARTRGPSRPQTPDRHRPRTPWRWARLWVARLRALYLVEAGGAIGGVRAAVAVAKGPRALAAVAALVSAVRADKRRAALAAVGAVEVLHQLRDVGAVVVAPLVVQVLAAVAWKKPQFKRVEVHVNARSRIPEGGATR